MWTVVIIIIYKKKKDYYEFCYENIAENLSKRYQSNIIIIRPSERCEQISEFTNFYQYGINSIHLKLLIEKIYKKEYMKEMKIEEITIISFSKGCTVLNQLVADISNSYLYKETGEFAKESMWATDEYEKLVHKLVGIKMIKEEEGKKVIKENYQDILNFYQKIKCFVWLDCHRFISNIEVIENFSNFCLLNNIFIKVYSTPVFFVFIN
jgi:hypothetical protein